MKQRIAMAAAICWTLLIVVAVLVPGQHVPRQPVFEFDKLIHAGLFFGFTLLWTFALARGSLWRTFIVLCVAISFGLLTEWIQGQLPYRRSMDQFDMLANGAGAFLAFLIWVMFGARRTKSARK